CCPALKEGVVHDRDASEPPLSAGRGRRGDGRATPPPDGRRPAGTTGRALTFGCHFLAWPPPLRFSRIFMVTSMGEPAKPNSSRMRRSMNRR
ncbi:MAG: hypothetical protein K0R62_6724, partial [Nonomuraea muscovyensis]|nr:hypothetical protein [Nonomuraea muscovyensis]